MRRYVVLVIGIIIAIIGLIGLQTNLITQTVHVEDVEERKDLINNKKKLMQGIETNGIHTLIGKSKGTIIELYGQPDRIDPSAYDYDWWIYDKERKFYLQIGIFKGKVVTVFSPGSNQLQMPFSIGQAYDEINSEVKFNNKVFLNVNGNSYRFELTKEELEVRPLIKVGKVWAQLYFDTFTNKLSSIRFMDGETLIKQRPYELVYRGELISPKEIGKEKWKRIEKGKEMQILALTNIIRKRHDLELVKWDKETAEVAYKHSKDMDINKYFSHHSTKYGGLSERLTKGGVLYHLAGENIAAQYVDAIGVVEGWLNSKGHRITLLNENFTHLGVGVHRMFYTQNFIKKWE